MKIPLNQVLCHDVVRDLPLPDECIDVVMTSPPYWGLRFYGEDVKSVFGGDPRCKHKWGDEIRARKRGNPGDKSTLIGTQTADLSKQATNQGNSCLKCGAWYGQLGLEPDPQMFIDHLVSVFREVRRVLKSTGSMYINLGSTYTSKDIFFVEKEYYGKTKDI